MKFTEYMEKLNNEREDKDNIFPTPISDRIALDILEEYLLDGEIIIAAPISNLQANSIIVHEILYRHSRKYRKEYKRYIKLKRRNKNVKN